MLPRTLSKSKLRHCIAIASTATCREKFTSYTEKLIQAIHDGKDTDAKSAVVHLLRLELACNDIRRV